MNVRISPWALVAMILLSACSGNSRQWWLTVQKALDERDADAMLAAAELRGAPAMVRFMMLDAVESCGAELACAVSLQPVSDTWEKKFKDMAADQGLEFVIPPEGLLHISGSARNAPNGGAAGRSLNINLPYARIGGAYKLIAATHRSDVLKQLRETTAWAVAEKVLSVGVYNPALGETDSDWRSKASALPVDGGAPGRDFVASTRAMSAAVAARDVEAAALLGDDRLRVLLRSVGSNGPVPVASRQLKLRKQALRFIAEAKVLGGYQLDEFALLVIEGTNGAGNIVRGAQFMQRKGEQWHEAGDHLIEIPDGG